MAQQSNWPSHWLPGQLLDLKRYTDGSCRATLLGEEYDPETDNAMHFDSTFAAQNFVSWWYLPAMAREQHGRDA